MFYDARITIHQKEYEHPDYRKVSEAAGRAGWFQRAIFNGHEYRTLGGMYRTISLGVTLEELERRLVDVLEPLGFDISLQIIQVAAERDRHLKPMDYTAYASLFGSLLESSPYGRFTNGSPLNKSLLDLLGQK